MVYIEGLHVSITVADLKALFAPFGTVLWSRLVIDTNSYSSVTNVDSSRISSGNYGPQWHHSAFLGPSSGAVSDRSIR